MTRKVGIEYIKIPFRGETLNEGNLPESHRQRTQPRRRPAGEAGTQPRRNRRRKREEECVGTVRSGEETGFKNTTGTGRIAETARKNGPSAHARAASGDDSPILQPT